ncbi:HD-GYP domain, c-di-GMP phosphodiesterase class II (or its inactivated variant) [Andreprevotia lacus DSM 23236]|jgi:HD-GYP domain-containing protein (c-di-GMP phosphodiesterase class II)|uniref:HD-GYP domain, c-di-GMP phosphodiesterase class II (Or its inactivated variant) n=1 Tax=Andreprevotia lacus DSM 23236 TaxID=1121001 RepID=A0A1W1WX09_9NEIS|nr:HD domain-containing phosphohydrolase [Andreprevotia lacus]SMC16143.1 HD-GYP domain, c-di-GMP phosphodiesterase class II (or its inactivated variant) [Andreprevotia lacus DSM 23236]
MSPAEKKRLDARYPLHIHISTLFVALIAVFALVNITYQYRQTSRMLLSASETLFARIGAHTVQTIQSRYEPTKLAVDLLAHQQVMFAGSLRERLQSLPYFVEALRGDFGLSSVYVGYESGDFFLVRRIDRSPLLMQRFDAPAGSVFMVQSVERHEGGTEGRYLFFDDKLQLMRDSPQSDYQFDPRGRPWYQEATRRGALYVTEPYLFFSSKEVGTTFARPAENGDAVVAADITLAELSNLLSSQEVTPSAELALVGGSNDVIAYKDAARLVHQQSDGVIQLAKVNDLAIPALTALVQLDGRARNGAEFTVGDREWRGWLAAIPMPGGKPVHLAIAAPQDELLNDALVLRSRSMLITAVLVAASMLIALWLSRLASSPIRALVAEAREIQALRFGSPLRVRSRIFEIDELAQAMGKMKATIQNFLDIGNALASERQFDSLLARLLQETADIAQAEGGVIYLLETDGTLKPAQALWHDEALADELHLPQLSADDVEHPAWRSYREGRVDNTLLDALALGLLFGGMAEFDYPLNVLTVPLKNQQDECIGMLLLLQDDRRQRADEALVALVEAVSGTAAVAIETQRLIMEQKMLLESFIQLIAGAIDAKSPYTGGHCQRVPELTKMLARAAERQVEGPYADFNLGPDEWEELHIAAWLHDCGKVTTPEYVVDKATKLETLYDRIHEVRMRFEVLKRDAEIDYWHAVVAGGDPARLKSMLEEELRQLDEDFAFIAECNVGGEFMAPEKISRLKDIAALTWRRTLSDRIGISHEEAERKAQQPEPELPAVEPLLADRIDHVFARGARDQLPQGHGFDMKVPEHLYNRGEIYNLSVARGTLSEEERYKINEHIVQTIVMLNKLPFPRHLRRVPEIAGGHHEKMDGSGYPKRLTRDEMSIAARMMAIADIFEALTAIDRPYKKGKTLSESLKIMVGMAKGAHVDPDLFRLFVQGRVYLEYAERYMQPQQLDEVDEAALLAELPTAA